jgi:anthranilate phosphoribosyltransferase
MTAFQTDLPVSFAETIRRLSGTFEQAPDLSRQEAHGLFAAMLDGGISDLQLGALLLALRAKGSSVVEIIGFSAALQERVQTLALPATQAIPVVIPSYHGARSRANLMPLLALLLARLSVPVLVHCTLDSHGGVSGAAVFRALGILPCASAAEAEQALHARRLALVPIKILSPGLAALLSLRAHLGVRTCAHAVAKLADPFAGCCLRLVPASSEKDRQTLRLCFEATGERALVMLGTEGEAYADPLRRPKLELMRAGETRPLFDAEPAPLEKLPGVPDTPDPHLTAAWIMRVLAGTAPLPLPIAHQLACCLFGTGGAEDFNEAKAIAAVQSGALLAA